jgi:ribosomal protein S14
MLNIVNNNWIIKNKLIRTLYKKNEIKKKIIKSLIFNINYKLKKKIYFDYKYKKFNNLSSISKTRMNCMFLGNSRSILKKFKLSRYSCKKFAGLGFLCGLKKASF